MDLCSLTSLNCKPMRQAEEILVESYVVVGFEISIFVSVYIDYYFPLQITHHYWPHKRSFPSFLNLIFLVLMCPGFC